MRIAIFGSRKEDQSRWTIRGSQAEFAAAARELGRKLAHLEHTIIVGGLSERTADANIVDGFVEIAGSNPRTRAAVQVIRPRDGASPYEEHARRAPHVFEFFSRSEGWWEGAHLVSVRESDAVVTIGGAKGTYLAGLATVVAGKRLVPIASFGGSSDALLKAVLASAPDTRARKLRKLNGPWSDHVLDTALDLVGATSGPRLLLIHGRSDDWLDLENWIRREVDRPVVVMGQEFGGGRTLPEKFEQLAGEVDGAIALATPDDLGGIDASDLPSRARQNVWVEVGWFWGRLGRDRLLLLRKTDVEFPSDLHGIEYYSYRHKPREVADSLRRFVTSLH